MAETEPLQGAVALGFLEILGQKKAFGDFRMHERFPSLELVSLGLSLRVARWFKQFGCLRLTLTGL